jgi:hypothetical protein
VKAEKKRRERNLVMPDTSLDAEVLLSSIEEKLKQSFKEWISTKQPARVKAAADLV